MRINVGIAGFGTIGSGVVHLLNANGKAIQEKTGLDIRVSAVADVDFSVDRGVSLEGITKYNDGMELVKDKSVDIVVELVGGVEFPFRLIKAALENGKHVVTANKALLAKQGKELYRIAAERELAVGIEASVAGGIPIIKTIREALAGNRIQEIRGIINGTCNYILTKMDEDGLAFEEALASAQQLGFAEADPTLDITGGDAAHKIAILASLAFNTPVELAEVHTEGIDNISAQDVEIARELGYVIKLVGVARDRGDAGIEARVHPLLLPFEDQLASIRNEFNAVFLRSDYLGDAMLTGKGAGSFPTASAVVGDLVDISRRLRDDSRIAPFFASYQERPMVPFGDTENRYYLHISTKDEPGILSRISGFLGERGISIASMIQREADEAEAVPLVMLTHTAKESSIREAVALIDALPEAVKPTVIMRAL